MWVGVGVFSRVCAYGYITAASEEECVLYPCAVMCISGPSVYVPSPGLPLTWSWLSPSPQIIGLLNLFTPGLTLSEFSDV